MKERTFRLGLDISGTAIGNDFCMPKGPEWDQQIAETQALDRLRRRDRGAGDSHFRGHGSARATTKTRPASGASKGSIESLDYAAKKGVFLALENHGGITSTPEQMLKIIHGVNDSPWFGVNFDGGNFRTADPYADLEKIAPYAINAQLKVDLYPNGKHEPTDLARVVDILRQANYRGYIVLEYEAMPDPFEAIPGHLKTLRS